MRGKKFRLLFLLALLCTIALAVGGTASAANTVVTPANPDGWTEANVRTAGQVAITSTNPRSGNGSLEFITNPPNSSSNQDKADYAKGWGVVAGRTLGNLSEITYETYRDSNTNPLVAEHLTPVFRLYVKNPTSAQIVTLIWERYYNETGAAALDTWEPHSIRNGYFWMFASGVVQNFGLTLDDWMDGTQHGGQSGDPIPPIITPAWEIVGINVGVGSGWAYNFQGYVDNIVVKFGVDEVTANFELCSPALVHNIDSSEDFCTIQEAIDDDDTLAGHEIHVDAGTFIEQVDDHKGVILVGAGAGSSFIKAPATIPGGGYIVSFTSGGSSEITGFTITGPGQVGCGNSMGGGIFVRNGSTANIHDNTITAIRDLVFAGCQAGVGIRVGHADIPTTGTATIKNNLIEDFQKNGITISGTGSSATIDGNTINGAGPTTVIAQNGIQIGFGATGSASGNIVNNLSYTPLSYAAAGILVVEAENVILDNNQVNEGQIGIRLQSGSATIKNNKVKSTLSGTGSDYFWGVVIEFSEADVTGNEITSDGSTGGTGLGAYDGAKVTALSATKNIIFDWEYGVEIAGTNFSSANINRNSITSNSNGMVNYNTYPVDGTCNWWGEADGPSTVGPGGGDTVSDNVDFLPWLLADELDGPCLGGYPQLVIEKKVISGAPGQVFPYELTGPAPDSFNLIHGGTKPLILPYGTYTLVENIPSGWQMADINCTDEDLGVLPDFDQLDFKYERDPLTNLAYGITFTLDEDEAGIEPIYCVFEQLEIPPHIVIKKIVEPGGNTNTEFDYHLTGTTNYDFDLKHGEMEIIPLTVPGSYQIIEDVPFGWQMTDLRCKEANTLAIPVPPNGDFAYIRDSNNLAYGFTFERGNGQWEPVYCEFTQKQLNGKLTIKKDTQHPNNSDEAFQFTVSGGSTAIAPFKLDDWFLNSTPSSLTFPVLSDYYTITETPEPGWYLTDITCAAKHGQGNVSYTPNLATHSVVVGVGGGQEVTCTFVNQKSSAISAVKYFDKNKDGDFDLFHGEPRLGGWEFTLYSADGTIVVAGPITTDSGGLDKGSATFKNLKAGTYLLCETDDRVPSLWANTQPGTIYNPPNAPCYQVTVGYNDLAIKLFGNYEIPQADLVVIKTDSPDPIVLGAGDITYTIKVENKGPDTAKNVTLVDTLPANVTFVSSVPGAPTCVYDSGSDTVTCDLGNIGDDDTEVVTITVTPNEVGEVKNTTTATSTTGDPNPANNTDDETTTVNQPIPETGTLKIVKDAQPDSADGYWQFTVKAKNGDFEDTVFLGDDGDDDPGDTYLGFKEYPNLPIDTYIITEVSSSDDQYALSSIDCTGDGEVEDEVNGKVEVTLSTTDPIICTFINTELPEQTGKITVVKNWSSPVDLSFPDLEDEPQFGFGLGLLGDPATTFDLPETPDGLSGTASTDDMVLPVGVYQLYENAENGWDMIEGGPDNHAAVCEIEGASGSTVTPSGAATVNIDLKAGDHVTCTFTNELITYDFTITKALEDGATVPGSDWQFAIYKSNVVDDNSDDELGENFTLPAAGGSKPYVVTSEFWRVAETVQAGYDLISVTCEPGGENIPNPSNDDVEILIQSVNNCTFHNDEKEPEPAPTLTVTKTDGQTSVQGETDLTYTITVKNTGDATATAVTLTDELPTGVMFLSGSTDTGTCAFPAANTIINAGNKTFTCDLGDLDPDATAIITVIVDTPAVTEAKDLTNKACAEAENADKACASDTTTVTPPGNVCANGGDWRKDLKHSQSKLLEIGNADSGEIVADPGYYIGQVKNINKSGQNCTYLVGLATYGKFDEIIDNQILMDWDWPRYVGPNETIYLRVAIPECAQQIDLFYGDILWSLDGQRYGNRLLDWHHVLGKQYCAAIRAKKVTEPAGDAQSFDFSIPQLGENFSLADGGVSEWFVYDPTDYGLVQVIEAFVDGWTVDNGAGKSACKTQTNAFANYLFQAPINPGDPTGFDVTALPGEKITCKFVNVKDAKLTIVKKLVTSEAENTEEFPFEITGDDGLISEPKLADGGSHSEMLPAGTYTVKETAFEQGSFESGYVFGKVECSNGASSDTTSVDVTLNPGDDVTCTFVNKRKATVTIYKDAETIFNSDTSTFEFVGDFPNPFPGPLGDGDFAQFFELTQKSYTVTETIPDSWALEDIVCVTFVGDNPYPNYSVDLANGELTLDIKWGDNVKCTFYNIQYRLEIQKFSDPVYLENSGTIYFDSLTLPDVNDGDPGKFDAGSDGGIHAYFIKPGVYDITELVPDGYALDEVTCNDPEQATPTITDNTVTIDLTEGNVTCNFYNVGVGSIKVIKDVADGEDPQDFSFFIDKVYDDEGNADNQDIADFDLDDDSADNTLPNMSEVYKVPLGTYIVGENELTGWTAAMDCRDQDNNQPVGFSQVGDQPYVQFDVELGKHIVCTFVNSYTPPTYDLTIQKSSDPGYDAQVYFSSGTIPDVNGADPGNFSVNGMDGQYTFENLGSGIYDATELVPDGYVLDHVTCNQVDVTITNNGVSIDLTQGDVICVFYNVEESDDVPGCIKENPERKDCSSMSVEEAYCEAGVAHFIVKNTGDPGEGDVNPAYPLEYRIYVDDILVETGYVDNFPGGTTKTFKYEEGGGKIVFEIDQQIGHPGNSHPNGKVENCFPPQTNEPPTAVISVEPTTKTLTCDQTEVSFDLSAASSTDSDGNIVSYAWSNVDVDNNDTTTVTLGVGTHEITLTVTDDDGATDDEKVTLTVNPAENCSPPDAVDDTYETNDGVPLTVNAPGVLGNDTQNGGTISFAATNTLRGGSVSWDTTTGAFTYTPPATSEPLPLTDQFFYTLSNSFGSENGFVNITIQAVNSPPTADISGELTKTLACNLTQDTFYLNASGSSDGDGFITTYVWSNGDVDNNQVTQVTMGAGTQDITLTVTDDDGTQDTLTVTLTLLAAPPQCFPPTSVGEEYYGFEDGGAVTGNVLDNDIYGGDPSEMSVLSLGGGYWSPNTDGTFSFAPGPNEFGTYPAPYQACALFCGNTVNATIHILPVNDEPSFELGGNLEVVQGSGAKEYITFAYDVTAGAGEDLDQQLTFELVPTGDAIFDSPPTIIYNTSSFSWHLLFTPSSTNSGVATIQVTLKDNGGTDNGGDDTSETKSFAITVLPPP